jgi:alkyldihydroxyacetonephosphate synthase
MQMMTFTGWGVPEKATDTSRLPKLWPFVHRMTGLAPDESTAAADPSAIELPPSRLDAAMLDELGAIVGVGNASTATLTRVLHAFGKSYRDLLRARRGEVGCAPDAVVFPGNHAAVEQVIAWATKRRVKLIPFGGGTNIVGGVEVSPALTAPVVTVSLRRMNQLMMLDEQSGLATMGAGMLGPELEAALNARGFTLGHFPDSYEFSTLGGWLATRSAGMQSDARGKIEDMVVSLKVATPMGTLETRTVPKAAAGPDLNQILVGSEGALGIITEATMRVYRVQPREYRGVLFPNFAAGVAFMRRIWELGIAPSTMRLSNPEETQFGLVLKPPSAPVKHLLTRAAMAYLRRVRGYDLDETCVMILGWEGSRAEIARRRKAALGLLRSFNGFDGGESAGNTWYARKYDYPYLRDLIMGHGGMVDVTETTVRWKDVVATYEKIHAGLKAEVGQGAFPGYVGCHLSHAYPTGVCVYFTFACRRDEADPLGQYLRVKGRAMDLVLGAGAALSHHHSIGYEHLPWLEQHVGLLGLAAFRGLKQTFDPNAICNPGRLVPDETSALAHHWPQRKTDVSQPNRP